ncbi:Alkaline phosphatase [Grimontia indica]|uniref:Alkaline phosphatase n=1 Tax=Grimontia indica TaxID=1056512 RepID=R1GPK9_9GAMM|nr:DUF4114 domain-containing protein [Grimontia indica]EOD77964.1 Alkaline phosphatase [Grimontia indica]
MATFTGTYANDKLNGTSGNDTIFGYEGNDMIKGGAGNDILNGGGSSGFTSDISLSRSADGTFDISGGDAVSLDFSHFTHSAAYNNSLGYYILDEDGSVLKAVIVADNVKNVSAINLDDIATEGGAKLGLFLIPDGDRKGFDKGEVNLDLSTNSATVTQGSSSAAVFTSQKSENGDGIDHERESGSTSKWEDLWGGGDNDFNDTTFQINVTQPRSKLPDNDTIFGDEGDDTINGGAGDDLIFGGRISKETVQIDRGSDALFDISGTEKARLDLSSFSHSAAYNNSLGYYILDSNGNVIRAVIVADNVKHVSSLKIDIDTTGGEKMGLFLIPDGDRAGFDKGEVILTLDGTPTVSQGSVTSDVFVSQATENTGNLDHERNSGDISAWEDLRGLGDKDFNDTVFTVEVTAEKEVSDKDTIDGGTGNDTIHAGDDADIVHGGEGDDKIFGGKGDDTLYGDEGADDIRGGHGNDTVHGGEGDDVLYGKAGNDTLDGGAGNDKLFGNAGSNTLLGGAGNDELYAGNGTNNRLDGGEGIDTYTGGIGSDILVFDIEDFAGETKTLSNGRVVNDQVYNAATGFDVLEVSGDVHVDFTGAAYQSDTTVNGNVIAGVEAIVGDDGNQTVTIKEHSILAQSDDTERGDWDGFVAYLGGGDDTFDFAGPRWTYEADATANAELTPAMIQQMGLTEDQASTLKAYVFSSDISGEQITLWTDAENITQAGNDIF